VEEAVRMCEGVKERVKELLERFGLDYPICSQLPPFHIIGTPNDKCLHLLPLLSVEEEYGRGLGIFALGRCRREGMTRQPFRIVVRWYDRLRGRIKAFPEILSFTQPTADVVVKEIFPPAVIGYFAARRRGAIPVPLEGSLTPSPKVRDGAKIFNLLYSRCGVSLCYGIKHPKIALLPEIVVGRDGEVVVTPEELENYFEEAEAEIALRLLEL